MSGKENKDLPGLFISVLPIVLPILLITGKTITKMLYGGAGVQPSRFQQNLLHFFSTLGDANIALAISAVIAIYLLWNRLKDIPQFKKFIYG